MNRCLFKYLEVFIISPLFIYCTHYINGLKAFCQGILPKKTAL